MINVSSDFRTQMLTNTKFKERADITLANGRVLNLRERDFSITNNNVSEGAGVSGFPLGVATCRCAQIELLNDNDQLSDYDFYGARIHLYLTYDIVSTHSTEVVDYGLYTVIEPATYGATIIITALNDMYKADKPYDTDLVYPATAGEILRDACTKCGIVQGDITFTNQNYIVQTKPTDVTYRQVIGWVAMLAGGNARIDMTGYLRIKSYGLESIVENSLDGGGFPHIEVDTADGGNFTDYSSGDTYDGGRFGDSRYAVLNSWKTLKIETDDVIITGVKDKETGYQYGNNGYVLEVDNKLITGDEENAIQLIGTQIIGQRLRPFEGDCVANPIVEFMDYVMLTDRKGNTYPSVITDLSFAFFGFTTIKNASTSANKSFNSYTSEATKALTESKKLVGEEKSAREEATRLLAQQIQSSSGLYMTQEVQQDLSTIYYMHNKPNKSDSNIIWRLSADAFVISTDGGNTYPYGFDVSGTAVLNKIYAQGIDADYINAGHLNADYIRGGSLTIGGTNNTFGTLKIVDSSGYEYASAEFNAINLKREENYFGMPVTNKTTVNGYGLGFQYPVQVDMGTGDVQYRIASISGIMPDFSAGTDGGLSLYSQDCVWIEGNDVSIDCTKIGFFGATPLNRQVCQRATSTSNVVTLFNSLLNTLANYGLITVV